MKAEVESLKALLKKQTLELKDVRRNALSDDGAAPSGEKVTASHMYRRAGESPVANESDATHMSPPVYPPLTSSVMRSPVLRSTPSAPLGHREMANNTHTQSVHTPSLDGACVSRLVGGQACASPGCADASCEADLGLSPSSQPQKQGEGVSGLVSRGSIPSLRNSAPVSHDMPPAGVNHDGKSPSPATNDGAGMHKTTFHNKYVPNHPITLDITSHVVTDCRGADNDFIYTTQSKILQNNVVDNRDGLQIAPALPRANQLLIKHVDVAVQTCSGISVRDVSQDKRLQTDDTTSAQRINNNAIVRPPAPARSPSDKGSHVHQIRTEQKWDAMRKEVIDLRAKNEELRMENKELRRESLEAEEVRRLDKIKEQKGQKDTFMRGKGTNNHIERTGSERTSSMGGQKSELGAQKAPLVAAQKRKRAEEPTSTTPIKRSRVSANIPNVVGPSNRQSAKAQPLSNDANRGTRR